MDRGSACSISQTSGAFSSSCSVSLMKATKIDPIPMSIQADTLIKVLNDAPLSVQTLRKALYHHGFHDGFDLITNHDVGFMEVTVRHLQVTQKETFSWFIIYIHISPIHTFVAWIL